MVKTKYYCRVSFINAAPNCYISHTTLHYISTYFVLSSSHLSLNLAIAIIHSTNLFFPLLSVLNLVVPIGDGQLESEVPYLSDPGLTASANDEDYMTLINQMNDKIPNRKSKSTIKF